MVLHIIVSLFLFSHSLILAISSNYKVTMKIKQTESKKTIKNKNTDKILEIKKMELLYIIEGETKWYKHFKNLFSNIIYTYIQSHMCI